MLGGAAVGVARGIKRSGTGLTFDPLRYFHIFDMKA